MKRFGFIFALFVLITAWAWITLDATDTPITPEQLREHVLTATPRWANYNEDLKAQLGSTPVARWKGELVRASIQGDRATVVFTIEGYWADTLVDLPILARDPLGDVLREQQSTREKNEVLYHFPLKPEVLAGNRSVWLEIQYPHHIKRIAFDSSHSWTSTP